MKTIDLTPEQIEVRIKFDRLRRNSNDMKSVFVKCRICKGSGLSTSAGGSIWINSSYCAKCNGYGGEFVSRELAIECDKCKSLEDKKGCSWCGGSGYLDWIENIVGKRECEEL